MLRTNCVWISGLEEPDTRPWNSTPCPPNLESDEGPKTSLDIPESEPLISEDLQTPDPKSCQGSDLKPPTHPAIRDLMYIRQQSQETVHHFWARFLLVKDKIKDCRDEDAISVFCNNCTDERILNAINRHHVLHFDDLATIVQKYCAMESAWKTQAASWEPPVSTKTIVQTKRMHPRRSPDPITKEIKAHYGSQNCSGGMARQAMQNTHNTGYHTNPRP